MQTDVCTIYLHDKASQKLIFRATEGLNQSKVGQFGLGFDEGLVGWVASREEPLNLTTPAPSTVSMGRRAEAKSPLTLSGGTDCSPAGSLGCADCPAG